MSPKLYRGLLQAASFAAGVCLIVFLLISSVESVVFDHGFYLKLYDSLQLAEKEGISQDDLEESIFMMTDYVEGKRDDLYGEIVWRGYTQPTFNEKEILHMKDVRVLWQRASLVRWWCLALFVLLGAGVIFLDRKTWAGWLSAGFLQALAAFVIVLIFLGMWMAVDFTSFWISFHHVFFSNDLWSLDPATDFMIVICPEAMFSTMIRSICLRCLLGVGLLSAVSLWVLKKRMPIGFMDAIPYTRQKTQNGQTPS